MSKFTGLEITLISRDGESKTQFWREGVQVYYGTTPLARIGRVTSDAGVHLELPTSPAVLTRHHVDADGVTKDVVLEEIVLCENQSMVFTFADEQVTMKPDFSTIFIAPPKVKKEKKTVTLPDDKKRKRDDLAAWMTILFCHGQFVNLLCAAGREIGREILGAYFPQQMVGISKNMLSIKSAGGDRVKVKIETDKYFFAMDRGNGVLDRLYTQGDKFVLKRGQTLLCFGIVRDADGYCVQIQDESAIMCFEIRSSAEKDDEHDLVELDEQEEEKPEADYDTDIGEDLLRADDNKDTKRTFDGLTAPKMITLNSIICEMLGSQIRSNFTEEIPVVRGDGGALEVASENNVEKMKRAQATNTKPASGVKKVDSVLKVFGRSNPTLLRAKSNHDELEKNQALFLRTAEKFQANYREKHGADYEFVHIIKTAQPTRRGVPRLSDVNTRFVDEDEDLSEEDICSSSEASEEEEDSEEDIIPKKKARRCVPNDSDSE